MAGATDDAQLMARYAAGDIAAFEALYARYKGPLYRYFLRQCGNATTASELFQGAWIRIIKTRERYEPTVRFTTYVYQIAHTCLVDHFRKAEANPEPNSGQPDPAFASARWSLVDWEQGPAGSLPGRRTPVPAYSARPGCSWRWTRCPLSSGRRSCCMRKRSWASPTLPP
jgi:DNA-directed RNA polymerase specialized sigma24 family protein